MSVHNHQDNGGAWLAVAGVAALAAGGWAWFHPGVTRLRGIPDMAAPPPAALFAATEPAPLPSGAPSWAEPEPPETDEPWVCDVFTAPTVYRDSRTGRFHGGSAPSQVDQSSRDFEPELLEVGRDPFRVQLVGFVGGGNRARGIFEVVGTSEQFLAGAGMPVPRLGLTIADLGVVRVPLDPSQDSALSTRMATAAVRDEWQGTTVRLTSRGRCHAGPPFARIALTAMGPAEECHMGYVLRQGSSECRLEAIQADPAAVVLSRRKAGTAEIELWMLTPQR